MAVATVERFRSMLVRAMLVAGAVVIPVGVLLAGISGGSAGLIGSTVGFGIAAANAAVTILILTWALGKPAGMVPSLLTGSYFLRILALAAAFYALRSLGSINMFSMLFSFLALFIAHTASEVLCAWRSFGAAIRK